MKITQRCPKCGFDIVIPKERDYSAEKPRWKLVNQIDCPNCKSIIRFNPRQDWNPFDFVYNIKSKIHKNKEVKK